MPARSCTSPWQLHPPCSGKLSPAQSWQLQGAEGRKLGLREVYLLCDPERPADVWWFLSQQEPAGVPTGFCSQKLFFLARLNDVSIKRGPVWFSAPQWTAVITGVAFKGVFNCCFVLGVRRWHRQILLLSAPLPAPCHKAGQAVLSPGCEGTGRTCWLHEWRLSLVFSRTRRACVYCCAVRELPSPWA